MLVNLANLDSHFTYARTCRSHLISSETLTACTTIQRPRGIVLSTFWENIILYVIAAHPFLHITMLILYGPKTHEHIPQVTQTAR